MQAPVFLRRPKSAQLVCSFAIRWEMPSLIPYRCENNRVFLFFRSDARWASAHQNSSSRCRRATILIRRNSGSGLAQVLFFF
jgi:hypothetical protein